MINVNQESWVVRITYIGDPQVLPGEPVIFYHSKKQLDAFSVNIIDNELPRLHVDKADAKGEAKLLQKQLDDLADSSTLQKFKSTFFVRVVRWDIGDYLNHKKDREGLSKVGGKRRRKINKQEYLKELSNNPTKLCMEQEEF